MRVHMNICDRPRQFCNFSTLIIVLSEKPEQHEREVFLCKIKIKILDFFKKRLIMNYKNEQAESKNKRNMTHIIYIFYRNLFTFQTYLIIII